jgi:hypothetical protein
MAPDRTILHLVGKKIPDPLSMLLACTLLNLSYAHGLYSIMLWMINHLGKHMEVLSLWYYVMDDQSSR